MIRTFRDKQTHRLFLSGKGSAFPGDIVDRARRKLMAVDAAVTLGDLAVPPSNRLEALKGDRSGAHSIRINDQWRICFIWQDGDAFDVEVCDYH